MLDNIWPHRMYSTMKLRKHCKLHTCVIQLKIQTNGKQPYCFCRPALACCKTYHFNVFTKFSFKPIGLKNVSVCMLPWPVALCKFLSLACVIRLSVSTMDPIAWPCVHQLQYNSQSLNEFYMWQKSQQYCNCGTFYIESRHNYCRDFPRTWCSCVNKGPTSGAICHALPRTWHSCHLAYYTTSTMVLCMCL